MSGWLFHTFAGFALLGALGLVASPRHPLAGTLSLLGSCLAMGALFVGLDAAFLGGVQILVSTGALAVVWLFVVELSGGASPRFAAGRQWFTKTSAVLLVCFLVIGTLLLLLPFDADASWLPAPSDALPEGFGGYERVGTALFTDFVLAFEALALLLLAGLIGCLVLISGSTD